MKAFIIADAGKYTEFKFRNGGIEKSMGASLSIGDCSRSITLDFNIYSPEDKKKIVHKAKVFREVINNFLDTVEHEAAKSDFKYVPGKKDGKSKTNPAGN